MTAAAQLPLAFEHRAAFGGEDFLVAPGNREAVAWIDRWPDWPAPVLVIHGPAGCGKTHLAQVFRARACARPLGADDLDAARPADLADGWPAFIVDDAEALLDARREEAMFHLYNALAESGRHLLMAARHPPSQWRLRLPDLASRLQAGVAVAIGAPDDALIAALLVKLFADRQLRVEEAVIAFMVQRMERTFEAARRLVAAIDALALAERRNITVPLVRRVLEPAGGDV
jgi:DnaA regulatory inactivator Hda